MKAKLGMSQILAIVVTTVLVMAVALFALSPWLGESCFERLERVHLYGEAYPGEAAEAENSC